MIAAHLRNEWRMHGKSVLVFVIIAAIIHCIGWTVLTPADWRTSGDPLATLLPAVITLFLGVTCCGLGLLNHDRIDGRLGFISRLPAGLKFPFLSKVILGSGAVVLAWLVGGAASLIVDGNTVYTEVFQHTGWNALSVHLVLLSAGLTLTYLGIAVSCWLPNGALNLPGTLLIAAGTVIPFYLIWTPNWLLEEIPWQSLLLPIPTAWEGVFYFLVLLPGSTLLVAWLSFLGFRKGGTSLRALSYGAPCLVGITFVLWGWIDEREETWAQHAFSRGEVYVVNSIIGKGGNYAFLTLWPTGRRYKYLRGIQDLETKDFRLLSMDDSYFSPLLKSRSGYINRRNARSFIPNEGCLQYRPVRGCPEYIAYRRESDGDYVALFSGETGEPVTPGIRIEADQPLSYAMDDRDEVRRLRRDSPAFDRAEVKLRIDRDQWLIHFPEKSAQDGDHYRGIWRLLDARNLTLKTTPMCDSEYRYYPWPRLEDPGMVDSIYLEGSRPAVEENQSRIRQIHFTEDHWLLIGDDGNGMQTFRIWNSDSGRYEHKETTKERFHRIRRWRDPDWLVLHPEGQKTVRILNRCSLDCLEIPLTTVYDVFSSPEEVAVTGWFEDNYDTAIIHIDTRDGKMTEFRGDGHYLIHRLYMPDSKCLYFEDRGDKFTSRLLRADLKTGELEQIFPNIEDES